MKGTSDKSFPVMQVLTVSFWNSSGLAPISSSRGDAVDSLSGHGSNPDPFFLCISAFSNQIVEYYMRIKLRGQRLCVKG